MRIPLKSGRLFDARDGNDLWLGVLAGALPDRPFRVQLWDGTALEPTNGGGPALTAVLGNNSQVLCSSIAAANVHLRAGKLRALAVTTATRSPPRWHAS